MFRKLILTVLVATGTVTGLTATPATATAQPPVRPGQNVRYVVLVRHGGQWNHYATFRDYLDASRAVWHLEGEGRDARIETVRSGR